MIVAIANQKGGVGKTVTAATIGHGAALMGFNTLLIDLDPQGNLGDSYGVKAGNDLIPWLGEQMPGYKIANIAPMIRPALWLLRSNSQTAALKTNLAGRGFVEYSIKEGLENAPFDLVIIDCAPSLDILHIAALVAADWLLIPTRLDEFAVKGVQEIITTLGSVRKRGGACNLAGIIPTFYERTTNESKGQLGNLQKYFEGLIWSPIPTDTKIRTANRAGKTLWEYAPKSRAIVDGYQPVLMRLLRLVGLL